MNDTTKIITFAVKEALNQHGLPADDQFKSKYYFKDSILFTSDSLSLEYLPKSIDTIKFKILSRDQILKLITQDSIDGNPPNYLQVANFHKTDSGYYLNVASLSGIPYGGGGVFGIEILKRGDSLIVLHKGSSNIN